MSWLKDIGNHKIKSKNTIEVQATQETNKFATIQQDFKISLKQSANLEIDNGSGYGIAKIHKLEDMI